MSISAVVLARNEEQNIKKCLDRLKFASETIVIDDSSTDKTRKIASNLKARVYTTHNKDFSEMRNLAKEYAKSDWLLYVDSDELVTDKLAAEIKLSVKENFSAFAIVRQNYFFGVLWPHSENMIRLIKKDALIGWLGKVHETARIKGDIGQLKNPILHYTHNDLSLMVDKTNEWSEIEAELRFKSGHPQVSWWRLFRVMFTAFWNSYVGQKGYKAGVIGLIESIYQSFSIFVTYAKLWEKQRKKY